MIVGLFWLKISPLWFIVVSSLRFLDASPLCCSSACICDACWVLDDGIVGVAWFGSSFSTSIGADGCLMTGDVVGSLCVRSA